MNGYNFTDRFRRALQTAREEAVRLGQDHVGVEHILLAIVRDRDGVAAAALAGLNVDLEEVQRQIEASEKQDKGPPPVATDLPYTSRAKKVLEFAMAEARQFNHSYVGTEHLLLGLVRTRSTAALLAPSGAGLTIDAAREAVARLTPPITSPATNRALALPFSNATARVALLIALVALAVAIVALLLALQALEPD